MTPPNRRKKRPLEEVPQATQSVGPNPSYSLPLQRDVNLPSSPSLSKAASQHPAASMTTQSTEIEDPFSNSAPIPTSSPGTLATALERGMKVRDAARIARETTVAAVAQALDKVLPDIKKNCPESAEMFEKLLLSAIEDLAAARPISTGPISSGIQAARKTNPISRPITEKPKKTYAEITKKDSILIKKPKHGEHNRPMNLPTDCRVMVRLDTNNPMRAHKPFSLMKKVNEVVGDPLCVKDAYATNTGVALVAGDDTKVYKILSAKDQLKVAFSATEIERQESWTTFLVQPVPKTVHSVLGNGIQIDDSALIEETERITGCRPVRAHWSAKSRDPSYHVGTVVLSFQSSNKPNWPRAVRFFGSPTTVQKLSVKKPLTQCENCYGFHHSRNCSRTARCAHCSRSRHAGSCPNPCSSHKCPPRCINCRGPHEADHTECPARPARVNGVFTKLSARQIRAVRAAGGVAWAQAHANLQTNTNTHSPNIPAQTSEPRTENMEVFYDEVEV